MINSEDPKHEHPKKIVELMNCEEFEIRGLDLDRFDVDAIEAQSSIEHARVCARCSALLESWREVKTELRLLREATRLDSAPARIEMRLKQELRTKRESRVPLGTIAISAWALPIAAVLIAALSWVAWERTSHKQIPKQQVIVQSLPTQSPNRLDTPVSELSRQHTPRPTVKKSSSAAQMPATTNQNTEPFTLLPGSLLSEADETEIVRVRMQRGALGTLGLPVNEDRAGEWIQVELLVGNDGLPQAVRLAR